MRDEKGIPNSKFEMRKLEIGPTTLSLGKPR